MCVARRSTTTLLAILFSLATLAGQSETQPPEPIRYTFRVVDAAKHIAEVDARIQSSGQPSLDLMMPIWDTVQPRPASGCRKARRHMPPT